MSRMTARPRTVVSTLLAIVFALSSVFVCVPVVTASEGHCRPTASMKPGCSHCPQTNVMDCCATSAPQPAVPQDTASSQAGASTTLMSAAGHADLVSVLPALQPPAVSRAVRGSPAHGYRSTDLLTLNAVFLI